MSFIEKIPILKDVSHDEIEQKLDVFRNEIVLPYQIYWV